MLEAGHTLLDCQIVELLAENDVYQCYLANCPDSTPAKLFLILPDPLLDQKQRRSVVEQADSLARRTFPGVGSLLKAGEIDGQLVFLYPYSEGNPLAHTLSTGCSVRQSVEIVKKVAECLQLPHNAGLCHGNLSPETIYLNGDSPYLTDFSLNQLIGLDYHSGILPQYTSPEQVRGETPGTAADIYSLGCVFYHLLTGQVPFSGDDAFAIAKQHLQEEFPRLPGELSLFQPLLDSLTRASTEERSTIDQMLEKITQLSAQQEIDQLEVSILPKEQVLEASSSTKETSLLDEAIDSSEIAARIEARLKEHAGDFLEPEPSEALVGEESNVTDGLDKVDQKGKAGLGRFALILLLGVVIGSGLYFLLNLQSPAIDSTALEKKIAAGNLLTADLDQGLRLWQEADFNGAEAGFKQIIAADQKDPRAYNNLAAFYAAQGNYEQARDYLELALATDERYATIYRNLGSVYAEMARGSYGRALQLDKTKNLISLPVFSSKGVVSLSPMNEETIVMLEQNPEKDTVPPQLSEVGKQIAAASIDTLNEAPPPIVEPQHQLEIVAEKENIQVVKEELPVEVIKEEPPSEIEPIDAVTVASRHEGVEQFMQHWAQAWSNQDADDYLTFYGEKFIPPAGKKRADWEDQRRTRLTTPKDILISLDDFQLIPQKNNRVQIKVVQKYQSDLMTDQFLKVFDLQKTEKSWEILRERSLGRVR